VLLDSLTISGVSFTDLTFNYQVPFQLAAVNNDEVFFCLTDNIIVL
jgi:hypothetical protein